MADPTPYERSYAFRSFPDDTVNPRQLGVRLDVEFDKVANQSKDMVDAVKDFTTQTPLTGEPGTPVAIVNGRLRIPQGARGEPGGQGVPGLDADPTELNQAVSRAEISAREAREEAQRVAGMAPDIAQARQDATDALTASTPVGSYSLALLAAQIPFLIRVSAIIGGRLIEWVRQAGGPCLGGGWVPAGLVHLEHFGALDGDTGPIWNVAIEWAQLNRRKLTTAALTLSLATPVKTYAYAGEYLEVELPPACRIVATPDFPAGDMLFRINAMEPGVSVSWKGGAFDGRLMPGQVPGFAPDLLLFFGPFDNVYVDRVDFINNDIGGTAGDSGLMIYGCNNIYVDKCRFFGATDASIYASGVRNTFEGESLTVTNCEFYNANVAVVSKREFKHHNIHGNKVRNCLFGLIIGGEADGEFLPGKYATIHSNDLENVTYAIAVRTSDRSLIYGNRIFNWGNLNGVPVNTAAIVVNGSSNCSVFVNIIHRDVQSHVDAAGIRIRQDSIFGETFFAVSTITVGNNINNAYTGIEEVGVTANNQYGPDIFRGVITLHKVTAANSRICQPPRKRTPLSATEAGVQGETMFDDNYLYIRTSPTAVRRVALVSW